MKKVIMTSLLAIYGCIYAAAGTTGAMMNERSITVNDIQTINTVCIDVPSAVRVYKADAYTVNIVADSKYTGIVYKIDGDKITISSKYDNSEIADKHIRIYIGVPEDKQNIDVVANRNVFDVKQKAQKN